MGRNIDPLDPILMFLDDDLGFHLETALSWYVKLWEAQKRCTMVFRVHLAGRSYNIPQICVTV